VIQLPPPVNYDLVAENISLDILYEDEFLIVINKPAGLVVHPAPGHWSGTLVNALLYHCKDLQGIGGEKRPGIVHRLDRGTSGVMVAAKEQQTHQHLVEIFKAHLIQRQYLALSYGELHRSAGTLTSLIGRSTHDRKKMSSKVTHGKNAVTHFKKLSSHKKLHLLELTLETGRTHQIRVHLSELLNCPILNDPLYAHPKQQLNQLPIAVTEGLLGNDYPCLHAKTLEFTHPMTKKYLSFSQVAPSPMKNIIDYLHEATL
jgi:23S rRNA pseudouridine1911/1915/1917 synthase